jgi:hypothetical protein
VDRNIVVAARAAMSNPAKTNILVGFMIVDSLWVERWL